MASALLDNNDEDNKKKVDLKGSDALFNQLAKGTHQTVKQHKSEQKVSKLLKRAKKRMQQRRLSVLNDLIDQDSQATYRQLLDDLDKDEKVHEIFMNQVRLASLEPDPIPSQSSTNARGVDDEAVILGLAKLRTLSLARNNQLQMLSPKIGVLTNLTSLDISRTDELKNVYPGTSIFLFGT